MKYYIVNAFTDEMFKGNPTGVCILDNIISDSLMQKIAEENNLSETAFVIKNENRYDLKWFTPKSEVALCAHATLGASYVISNYIDIGNNSMTFNTASGELKVNRNKDLYEIELPLTMPKKIKLSHKIISDIFHIYPTEIYLSRDLFLVFDSQKQIEALTPDFTKMDKLEEGLGVIATSKGDNTDFVSRCFFPKLGVNEDSATGSAHSSLAPFWSKRLNKTIMTAKQLSSRGGTLYCEISDGKVKIRGKVIPYLSGNIDI